MPDLYALMPRFRALFSGLESAYGTGRGEWVKRPHGPQHWLDHLEGRGPGLGIGPLRPDNTVKFAAIDLDEPDFETARDAQNFIPGPSFVERSRSGNAHVWVFFAEPCPAWVAMGVLREVCIAVGKPHTEVFPKNHDFARVKLGNYINLPFHGEARPILCHLPAAMAAACGKLHPSRPGAAAVGPCAGMLSLEQFLDAAEASLNSPKIWEQRAGLLLIQNPADRRETKAANFGEQDRLHMCAEYIIDNMESNPLQKGGRHDTMFVLAKQLSNCRQYSSEETLALMRAVNEHAQPPIADSELVRTLRNVEQGQFTSLGCDTPNVLPYVHPNCPIVSGNNNPRSRS